MDQISNQLSNFCVGIGRLVSWLTLAMVILLSLNVLSSWLFNQSSIWASESITWMHSANFLFAAAYTLNRNEHVRVDIFYAKMSAQKQAIVDFFGTLLFLLPLSGFILWSSWSYVMLSWKANEMSAEAGGLPALYLLKGMLIVMPVLLIIEGLSQLTKQYAKFSKSQSNRQTMEAN